MTARRGAPRVQLAYSATYKLSVKAKSGDEEKTVTSSFTTMARPGRIAGADIYFGDGDTVGIGMPLVVEFSRDIPGGAARRGGAPAFVSSTPKVEGSWHWYSGGEVRYRPKAYWAVGTKIAFRAAVGGLLMGGGATEARSGGESHGRSGRRDEGQQLHQDRERLQGRRPHQDDAGQPGQARHADLVRHARRHGPQTEMIFDSSTFGRPVDGPGGYRKKVYWDVRYTWKGEFFHAAPWSVGDQGKRNVSNGCVNLSPPTRSGSTS